jgi:hypothetical protein
VSNGTGVADAQTVNGLLTIYVATIGPDDIPWYYPLEGDIRKAQTAWDGA